ncbi:Extradiol aromatic ring-opening dioxygenase [Gigaspora margarita]|uniref:Extradiol aromatic ring-opening dioxygenase n=1 Tax=Gigaspora margarita TaxID=4874 RepID=A0A8H4EUN2_GIGMA|nr:Extradiol aromatic ring-opening dioxygenase [Gigaspora margarita]
MSSDASSRLPCYFLSHGGPTLVLDNENSEYKFLQQWGDKVLKEIQPKAIVIISAHWETKGEIRVGKFEGETPIIYDFGGFSEELYRQEYHSKGSPELAEKIVNLLKKENFKASVDTTRGLDHGVWVPLKVAIPEPKDIPIVQISLMRHASYEYNIKVGRTLAPLRDEGVLIIGSGTMVHNLRDVFRHFNRVTNAFSRKVLPYTINFEKDLDKILLESKGEEREKQLIKLIDHPHLRQAHPTDDHLVPIHIAAGAAGQDQGKKIFEQLTTGMSLGSVEFCASG